MASQAACDVGRSIKQARQDISGVLRVSGMCDETGDGKKNHLFKLCAAERAHAVFFHPRTANIIVLL